MGTLNLAPFLFLFVALIALIGAIMGLVRGISRQLIRTITVVVSGVLAFLIATGSYSLLMNFFDGKTMADVIGWLAKIKIFGSAEKLAWLNNIDMETVKLVMTLPVALIALPIVFVAVFILLSGIMMIVHVILCAVFGFSKKKNNLMTRILGMGLGLIQGVIVAGLLLTPIVGISNSIDRAITTLNETAPQEQTTLDLTHNYNKYVRSVSKSGVVKAYSKLGINGIYHGLATVKSNGEKFDTTKLIPDVAIITGDIMELKGCDFKNLTPENQANINSIYSTVDNNSYLKEIFAGGVKTAAHFLAESGKVPKFGEPVDSIFYTAMTIFETTDSTNVMGDAATIKEVYFTLSNDGVLSSFNQGSDALLNALTNRDATGNTTVNKVLQTIKQNERTKPLITLITQISISVISQQTGIDSSTIEKYENIITNINNDVIKLEKESYATEEEYVEAVSSSLDTTLKNNSINLDEKVVDEMAQYIADNYSEVQEITTDQANDIILSYYDAYLKNQEIPNIPGLPQP